jgi:hypothetical protein
MHMQSNSCNPSSPSTRYLPRSLQRDRHQKRRGHFGIGDEIDVRDGFVRITGRDGGGTSDSTWVWPGDTLMDLNKYHALKMDVRKIGSAEYLFVESGGFNTRHKPDWKSLLHVMKWP